MAQKPTYESHARSTKHTQNHHQTQSKTETKPAPVWHVKETAEAEAALSPFWAWRITSH